MFAPFLLLKDLPPKRLGFWRFFILKIAFEPQMGTDNPG
jgi:hypothetical protein